MRILVEVMQQFVNTMKQEKIAPKKDRIITKKSSMALKNYCEDQEKVMEQSLKRDLKFKSSKNVTVPWLY